MTAAQLQEIFSACGRVEGAKVISDKISGRSKGFGFVEMATDTEAQAAIQKFNGSSVGSRNIVVNEARPMEDRKGGGGGGFRGNRGGGGGFGGGGGGRREGGGYGGNGGNSGGGRREGGFGGGKDDFGAGNRPRRDRGDGSRGGGRRSPDGESFGNRW
jgi:RNA recognition motif-containing protein